MAKIIAIVNQKGGVGKTTTSINLSACLAEKNKKILVIDLDPQGNTTSGLGINKYETEYTIYELLLREASVIQCICNTQMDDLDLISSNINLSGAEIDLINQENREYILRDQINQISDMYDYIIIDCPPALSMLTINALTTADSMIIPIQCEFYALEGLTQILNTASMVKERLNPKLNIMGILFTMYDSRTNLANDVIENVKTNMDEYIFNTVIPRNIRLAEAPSYGMPINLYDSKSTGAERYRLLADEVMNLEE